jgi:hypothetical protein
MDGDGDDEDDEDKALAIADTVVFDADDDEGNVEP